MTAMPTGLDKMVDSVQFLFSERGFALCGQFVLEKKLISIQLTSIAKGICSMSMIRYILLVATTTRCIVCDVSVTS